MIIFGTILFLIVSIVGLFSISTSDEPIWKKVLVTLAIIFLTNNYLERIFGE